jgi:hypothetical protein
MVASLAILPDENFKNDLLEIVFRFIYNSMKVM